MTTPVRITKKRSMNEHFTARQNIAFGDITNQCVHDADKSLNYSLGDDCEIFAFYGDEGIGEVELLFYASLSRLFIKKPFKPMVNEKYEPIHPCIWRKLYITFSVMYLHRNQNGVVKSLGIRKAKGEVQMVFL